MKTLLIPLLLTLLLGCNGRAISPSSKCDNDTVKTDIGRCLRPFMDLWETVRAKEKHAENLLFPIPFYTKESIVSLCYSYVQTEEDCSIEDLLKRCNSPNEMITFMDSHLRFFCGKQSPIALDHFSCISASLLKSRQCHRHIMAPFSISKQTEKDKCRGMPEFYTCVEKQMKKDCGLESHAVFTSSIVHFGCNAVDKENEREAGKIMEKFNSTGSLTLKNAKEYIRKEHPSGIPEISLNNDHEKPKVDRLFLDANNQVEIAFGGEEIVQKVDKTEDVGVVSSSDVIEGSGIEDRENGTRTTIENGVWNESLLNGTIIEPILGTKDDCTRKLSEKLNECYIPITDRLESLRSTLPLSLRLPLFNTSSSDITGLCSLYQSAIEECLDEQMKAQCSGLDIVSYVDQQLGPTCAKLYYNHNYTITMDCVTLIITNEKNCLKPIQGIITPMLSVEQKCAGQMEFLECVQPNVLSTCGMEGMNHLHSIVYGYGCDIHELIEKTISPEEDDKKTEVTTESINIEKEEEKKKSEVEEENTEKDAVREESVKKTETTEKQKEEERVEKNETSEKEEKKREDETVQPNNEKHTQEEKKEIKREREDIEKKETKEEMKRDNDGKGEENLGKVPVKDVEKKMDESSMKTGEEEVPIQKDIPTTVKPTEEAENEKKTTSETKEMETTEEPLLTEDPSTTTLRSVETKEKEKVIEESNDVSSDFSHFSNISQSILLSSEDGIVDFEEVIQNTTEETFSFPIGPECTVENRDKSRVCISPLMRTWIGIREQRPELEVLSFPLYKYTRLELLELCDGYANTFLCAGYQPITKCINDELVRFAQDHLGNICSPQNIARFMHHYDCIMEQEQLHPKCRQNVMGKAMPGKDQHKCTGVDSYRTCLHPFVTKFCPKGAMAEFDSSITQFGCKIGNKTTSVQSIS